MLCEGCGSGQMSEYERGQLMLQQQQLQLRQQQLQQDAAMRASENATRMTESILGSKTPEYGVDPNQGNTNCITGTDTYGRLVTRCQSN